MWPNNQCSTYTILLWYGFIQLAQSASLRCYYNDTSLTRYEEVPLKDGKSLLTTGCFDVTKRTLFYIFGFGASMNADDTTNVTSAAIFHGDLNVIVVNWAREASSNFLFLNDQITNQIMYYSHATPNVCKIGKQLGNTVVSMKNAGLDLEKTILVGHSLGAHVAAQAGRTVIFKQKVPIGLIIGLDPAGPGFSSPISLPSLASDCASFVYTVLTDPGGYGINKTQTHVDILVNCAAFFIETDKEKQLQPGCSGNRCSHMLSWKLFVESLKLFHTLLAGKAISCANWVSGNGDTSDNVNIGLDIDQTKRGIYFLSTNSASPYGKGKAGLSL